MAKTRLKIKSAEKILKNQKSIVMFSKVKNSFIIKRTTETYNKVLKAMQDYSAQHMLYIEQQIKALAEKNKDNNAYSDILAIVEQTRQGMF